VIRKIVSSARTGVELAGLDVAVKLGLEHGGWAPRGMRNDNGSIPAEYGLIEASAVGFQFAMERNIIDSDGTLLVTRGHKSDETRYAVQAALRHQRQLLHADLSQHSAFEAASLISSWASLQNIRIAFITGPSAAQDAAIYRQVRKIVETAFYLAFVKTGLYPEHRPLKSDPGSELQQILPSCVEEAVDRLKEILSLKDRAIMANLQPDELDHLGTGLGDYIKQNFGLFSGNEQLLDSCAKRAGIRHPIIDEACAVILRALWEDLRSTHRLRIIK
jgi:hypothetical protein